MDMKTQRSLKQVQRLLQLAILLLVMAEVLYILQTLFNYLWGVVGACLILIFRFVMYRMNKQSGWKQWLLLLIPVLVILGPLIYLMVDVLFFSATVVWLDVFLVCAFVIPIIIMALAYYLLKKVLLASNQSNIF